MNVFVYLAVLAAALMSKTGSFSFYAGTKKKTVSITADPASGSLGKFSFAQAASIASQIAKGSGTVVVRAGAYEYTLTVQ